MTDYGTIKIPEPAYDHHNERRKEMGKTWEQYINGEAPSVEVDEREIANAVTSDLLASLPSKVADELRR